MKHEGEGDSNCGWCTWNHFLRTGKKIGRLGNKRAFRDHPDYSIIKIDQNTETSPGDLRRLAVTQTPVRNQQLTLVGKTLRGVKKNNNLG